MDLSRAQSIIGKYRGTRGTVIASLLDLQEEFRYLPREALVMISRELNIPRSQLYSLATFFKAFSLQPKGKYEIHVCTGTACHVKGATKIIEKIERDYNVTRGGTSPDLLFSLEEVHCLGCCGLAPVMTVNEDLYGKMSITKVTRVMRKYSQKEAANAQTED
ncbi:MAG: NAD(P)H-dependent oxidoreductase subunit E [bacterium]